MKKLLAIATFSFFSVFSVNTWAEEFMIFGNSHLGDQLVGEPESGTAVCLALVPWCMGTKSWAEILINHYAKTGQYRPMQNVVNELKILQAKGVIVPYEQAYTID